MATSRLIFGPDLEPLESESRRGAHNLGPRRDSLTVDGSSAEVATRLIEATANTVGWCELEQALPDAGRRTVFVNAHTVRWVVEDDSL